MSDGQAEPKIVVDEDWKSKVQAEKQAAAEGRPEPPRPAAESAAGARARPAETEVLFAMLVSTLAEQTMLCMGKRPDPAAGHPVVRPDLARHYIDTLGMLEAKTKGNLTADEAALLAGVLHQLRMLFVTVRPEPPAPKQAEPKESAEKK